MSPWADTIRDETALLALGLPYSMVLVSAQVNTELKYLQWQKKEDNLDAYKWELLRTG